MTEKEYNKKYYQEHKEQRIAYVKEWYKKHKEERKKYNAEYWKKNKKELSAKHTDWWENNKETKQAYSKKWWSLKRSDPFYKEVLKQRELERARKEPGKRKAVSAVRLAVLRGELKKLPCAVCGEKEVEGHHKDYRRKLTVIWLCKKHHKELHKSLKNKGEK